MAKRELSEWASIAEIISAVAVVLSLLYVGFEIHRNTRVGLAANRQAVAARVQELALYSAEIDINRLISAADNDTAELSDEELNRLTAYVGALLRTTEEAYLLYRDGLLDQEYRLTRAGVLLTMLSTGRTPQIYHRTRDSGFYTSDFIAWVDRALSEKYGT